jgi:hypothetical protein
MRDFFLCEKGILAVVLHDDHRYATLAILIFNGERQNHPRVLTFVSSTNQLPFNSRRHFSISDERARSITARAERGARLQKSINLLRNRFQSALKN